MDGDSRPSSEGVGLPPLKQPGTARRGSTVQPDTATRRGAQSDGNSVRNSLDDSGRRGSVAVSGNVSAGEKSVNRRGSAVTRPTATSSLLAPLRKATDDPEKESRLRSMADLVVQASKAAGSKSMPQGGMSDRAARLMQEDISRLTRRLAWVGALAVIAFVFVAFLAGYAVWVGMSINNNANAIITLRRDNDATWPAQISASSATGVTRTYYVSIEDVMWDFAPVPTHGPFCCTSDEYLVYLATPSGCRCDLVMGGPVDPQYVTQWPMTRFLQYTDRHFLFKTLQPSWVGIAGPVLRAEVGDNIVVNVRNSAAGTYSIHAHGVTYGPTASGSLYSYNYGNCAAIPPGGNCTYTWLTTPAGGPLDGAPSFSSSKGYAYYSNVNQPADTAKGLFGGLILTDRGMANADGTPNDVDTEFCLIFAVMPQDGANEDGNMHAINGRGWGNLQGLLMSYGAKARFHFITLGNEVVSAHIQGKQVRANGDNLDTIPMMPGTSTSASMIADNPGIWIITCMISDNIYGGMYALYTILAPGAAPPTGDPPVAVNPLQTANSDPISFASKILWKNGDLTVSPPPPPPNPPGPPAPPHPPPYPPGQGWYRIY